MFIPDVRCRWFDDDGFEIPPGCDRGPRCGFVHPYDPSWHTATRTLVGSRRMKGRSSDDHKTRAERMSGDHHSTHPLQTSPNRTKNSGRLIKGKEPEHRSTTTSTVGEPSSQSARRRSSGSGSATRSGPHGLHEWFTSSDTWGSGSSSKPVDGPSASGSSSVTQPAPSTDGWGWGNTGSSTSAESAAWGNTDTGTLSAWGNQVAETPQTGGKRGNDGKEQVSNAVERPSSSSGTFSPAIPSADTDKSRKEAQKSLDSSRSTPQTVSWAMDVDNPLSSQRSSPEVPLSITLQKGVTKPPPASTEVKKSIPLPKRSALLPSRNQRPNIVVQTETLNNKDAAQDEPATLLSDSTANQVRHDDSVSATSSPLTACPPHKLYADLINAIVSAVYTRCKLAKAEEAKNKWRSARASTSFQHCPPAAQKRLDAVNQQYYEEVSRLTKTFNNRIKYIVEHAEALAEKRDLSKRGVDPKKVASYTKELKEWMQEMDFPGRILAAHEMKKKGEEEKKAFSRRTKQEVDAFMQALDELEAEASDLCELFSYLQYICNDDIEEQFQAAEQVLSQSVPNEAPDFAALFDNLSVGNNAISSIQQRNEELGNQLDVRVSGIVDLVTRVNEVENEVRELRARSAQIDAVRQELKSAISQYEQWHKDHEPTLSYLFESIQNLHALPQPIAEPLPLTVKDLAPHIDKFVQDYLREHIQPIFDKFIEACREHNRKTEKDFDELVEPIMEKMAELCKISLQNMGVVPTVVKQPVQGGS